MAEEGLSKRYIAYCYFLTIAAIVGTGILAIPVKLWSSGFWPFLISFTSTMFVQVLMVFFTTELLQRCELLQRDNKNAPYDSIPFVDGGDDKSLDGAWSSSIEPVEVDNRGRDLVLSTPGPSLERHGRNRNRSDADEMDQSSQPSEDSPSDKNSFGIPEPKTLPSDKYITTGPSLHSMGKMFLGKYGALLFNVTIVLNFIAMLISYALALGKALCQLAGCNPVVPVAPLVFVFTCLLVFCFNRLRPFLTIMTMAKCVMLIVMIFIVGFLAQKSKLSPESEWKEIGSPFLLGTISLSGAPSVMPVFFSGVPRTRRAITVFQNAVIAGLATCYVLNILWSYFVLELVPQHSAECSKTNISLECSFLKDEISTQPVADIVKYKYSSLMWLGDIVSGFILLSLSVSFLTMGAGLKHQLDGLIKSIASEESDSAPYWFLPSWTASITRSIRALQGVVYTFAFSFIAVLALANPHSFLTVLDVFVSLLTNVSNGLLLSIMFKNGRKVSQIPVLVELGDKQAHLWIVSAVYFGFAVVYDIVDSGNTYFGKTGLILGLVFVALVAVCVSFMYMKERRSAGTEYISLRTFSS